MDDGPLTQTLAQFYDEYSNDPTARDRFYERQIEGRQQTSSTFLRITVDNDTVTVEIYRDDGHGGPYSLRETVTLD
jgi:hypothetical protein